PREKIFTEWSLHMHELRECDLSARTNGDLKVPRPVNPGLDEIGRVGARDAANIAGDTQA
ncbi:MAG TPA: hypothetical protein VD859_11650, partial [Nocardioides sp.]|nr:hypothetical protein [Nocardioides sp.]